SLTLYLWHLFFHTPSSSYIYTLSLHDALPISVVAKLCNASYEAVDAEARRLSSLADAPLDLEGSVWALRSATDAFTLLGCLVDTDRKSTRLNSSHGSISYAVFCLKKKKLV